MLPMISYYNLLRTQRWIGNLSLVVERELFGQEPLNEIHGDKVGDRLEEQLRRLAEVLLPLQDRAGRMMTRSLEFLDPGLELGPQHDPERGRRNAWPPPA